MKLNTIPRRNITTEKAVEILKKNGIEVNKEQAEKILDFMYFLAKLSVHQYFNEKKD